MADLEMIKRKVGKEASQFVESGMTIGLGFGSTAYWLIQALGERVKNGEIFYGVPTSNQTAEWAKEVGIHLTDFAHVTTLDVAIDGADEVDENFQLIKGGGGALLREKIVASAAKEFIVIVDYTKIVQKLGAFPLPIEIIPFGYERTQKQIADLGLHPALRKEEEVYLTDNGNYILDCDGGVIENPSELSHTLHNIPGVVESGLFIDMAAKVIVGKEDSIEILDVKK
ncbi:ribose-5-phosphate isomerase A [Paraliobacillus ryukyuensis]|uniref:Ribose-5-phosphate isomerase A n=1 Tax=Paraliobacillus ryukyuensis TaxID=200904 RepID=A0A366EFZ4_9BACI|nr:ribose-5-phosphate isomerase RpiA [Paraliobacillus ryukyuensis]RBP00660.1 ribose-5-phosphate isomerase [Paraliobacillus ryukyuensis]